MSRPSVAWPSTSSRRRPLFRVLLGPRLLRCSGPDVRRVPTPLPSVELSVRGHPPVLPRRPEWADLSAA